MWESYTPDAFDALVVPTFILLALVFWLATRHHRRKR